MGRPKGAKNKKEAQGTKRVSFAVSCQPWELEKVNELAKASGKTKSRFLLDLALKEENVK